MTDSPSMKVTATNAALELIEQLKMQYGPNLLFHQSGGCCDGSAPMCYPDGDYIVGDNDVLVGVVGGLSFYMNADQYDRWQHTNLIIDAIPGIGGMFSLENGTGKRFLTRSDVCMT
ncbi:DUF779 domain-containing protein [Roseovarius sp. CAU 1744]|uniref:DUF779 domain-containing protein n=1 Tax=Roseovarius sp. CAU 1744 TaxID=3140368 RepID=UPI00325C00BB